MTKNEISLYDWCIENNPLLLEEWDYEDNERNGIDIHSINYNSMKKAHWICKEKNHPFDNHIRFRTVKNINCPFCRNYYAMEGENDLATTNPDVAEQWFHEMNIKKKIKNIKGDLATPNNVVSGSKIKVWWKCEKGHFWEAAIFSRTDTNNPRGCPFCAGKKVWPGDNDLAKEKPDLVDEWCYERNHGLIPQLVTKGSHKKV